MTRERDILKKGDGVLRDGVGVKHAWVERHKWHWPVSVRWLADQLKRAA